MDVAISADRGTITDRNGTKLAVSSDVKTVYISPNDIEDETEAREVSKSPAGASSSTFSIEAYYNRY
jgi:cell division protein FtsI/penicillin-binding protein 2